MKLELGIQIARFDKFYGKVASLQNKDIMDLITGRKILDIGCGCGHLVNQIVYGGREAVGIDVDDEVVNYGKSLYGVDLRVESVFSVNNGFDTVILRETLHHLNLNDNFAKALGAIAKVCLKELIVFEPNPNFIVKISRILVDHKDPEGNFEDVKQALERSGFKIQYHTWRDVIAFPLSGGLVAKELVPEIRWVESLLLWFDRFLNNTLKILKLQKYFCWRYLIYAARTK